MNDPTLKRLAALSKTLNQASDLISKQIKAVESSLNALRLGVQVWVEVVSEKEMVEAKDTQGKGTNYQLTHVVLLGYAKHKGKWALVVADGHEEFWDGDDLGVITLLSDTKRELKLAAVEKFPELLGAIEKKATEVTEQATKKAEQIKEIAAELGRAPV